MPVAWRLVKAVHAPTAFGGEGAARTGGRWNSRGQQVVYASATQSLAVLEFLVHLDYPKAMRQVFFRLEFPDSLVTHLPTRELPADWQQHPPSRTTRLLGDRWHRERRSAILAVPSAVVPDETNYLINPLHPDFKGIRISSAAPFSLDARLRR